MEIYVHLPFCKQKCSYCDFTSFSGRDEFVGRYLDALIWEIALAGEKFKDRQIDTVYIGGGTPSYLKSEAIINILESLEKNFLRFNPVEITIEGNPESLSEDKIKAYKSVGVNRVSIGVQSLNDKNLLAVGRIHDSTKALATLEMARRHIDNLSCDFIVGLPYDTPDVIKDELIRASVYLRHISVYELTLEEGTPLFKAVKEGGISLPNDDEVASLYDVVLETLRCEGFNRYEVSNFARGYECKHNIGYWEREEYIGFGCGAHSFYGKSPSVAKQDGLRVANEKDFVAYINSVASAETFDDIKRAQKDKVEGDEAIAEEIMLGLRTARGVRAEILNDRIPSDLIKHFFIESKDGRLALTDEGLAVMNSILTQPN